MEIMIARLDHVTSNATVNMVFVVRGRDLRMFVSFKIFPGSLYFWEIQNIAKLKLNFLQNIPLVQKSLLPVTVNVSETFLEAILWKPFQLCCRILKHVSSITKSPSLQCWF